GRAHDHHHSGVAFPRRRIHPARLRHRDRGRARQHDRRPFGRPADRRQRSRGRPAAAAVAQKHVQLRAPHPGPAAAAPGPAGQRLAVSFIRRLAGNAPPRILWSLGVLLALLLLAPALLGKYWLSVLILILYFAYVGQAWNVLMGFAGQLSLGHALYAGLGGYIAAGLYFHYGIGPWAGLVAAVVVAGLVPRLGPLGGLVAAVVVAGMAGAIVGYLGFRFSLAGVYFALLTIAFSEFTRVAFDHCQWAGGSGGLVTQ